MKLSYFELLSPNPIYIKNVGNILSIKLRNISELGIDTYYYYLTILSLNLKSYFSLIKQEETFESLSDDIKNDLMVYDLLIDNEESLLLLQNILNFFIYDDVIWNKQHQCFFVNNKDNLTIGFITRENYRQVCDLIFQRNHFKSNNDDEDLSKIKSKKALEIMKKIQKGRAEKNQNTKADKNMELGNIISAVANRSQSLNIINIWDLTIFQLWDCFSRLTNNNIYDIKSMSVAAWGDKENHFDATGWFKKLDFSN